MRKTNAGRWRRIDRGRALVAVLTIVWLVLSLHIGLNLDLRPDLTSSALVKYINFGLLGDFSTGGFDVELNETMRQLRLSTPAQEKPEITIANAPPHSDGTEFEHCEISCRMKVGSAGEFDGAFGDFGPVKGIELTMESVTNYPHYNYEDSKKQHRIVMNTQLISDIPMHYNNWEYHYLRPIEDEVKPESAMASAFISNCGARSFRLRAIEALRANNVTIEQYGTCDRTREPPDGNDKLATIATHTFTLSFENSEEEDYVTEKFFQAFEAGTIPVHLGAPNVDDFAPLPDTYLHLRSLEDVPDVAARMHEIANSAALRRHYLRFKTEGLSDKFLALTDMTTPHTFCQACYKFADDRNDLRRRARENVTACRMTIPRASSSSSSSSSTTTLHRFYVRERTQFVYRDLFVMSKFDGFDDVTYDGFLANNLIGAFRDYRPTWTYYRDEKGRPVKKGNRTERFALRVHRICDVYANVKTCLYSKNSSLVPRDDVSLRRWLVENPCGELAVVFI
ncbi:hypothetical protein ACHAW5_010210 [Stephanodiscus triporus]|uniref:Fucosyltransferase n=1 Tax=Stephanodiscus triporus TaxID=2934178 RepID=A0ABD3PMB6_9STRA